MNKILQGDCLEQLKTLEENSVDLIATDPPYGIGFMGKEWDTFKPESLSKGVARSSRKSTAVNPENPSIRERGSAAMESARYDHSNAGASKFREWFTGISVEMLRVLKPGAFAFVCIGARQDSVSAVITAMTEAGFKTDFTSIYWTYASGFPKAMNIGKMVDKRFGAEREVIGVDPNSANRSKTTLHGAEYKGGYTTQAEGERLITAPATPEAKALDGSYGGFQPKPAVEVIIVAMKPLSEKTFVDQALKNGKGITWLDDARIPFEETPNPATNPKYRAENGYKNTSSVDSGSVNYKLRDEEMERNVNPNGRFPANLLASDNVIQDHSRFFSLDEWAEKTMPFLVVPKASRAEKNKGLDALEDRRVGKRTDHESDGRQWDIPGSHATPRANHHPTVKPIKLMSYLVTLGSRPGDVVLDPFLGSGTTGISAKLLGRDFIGIEREQEYCDIAESRINAWGNQPSLI